MSMKRFIVVLLLFAGIVLVAIYHFSNIPYYKHAEERSGLTVECHNDDTIRIAYVGDSWADLYKRMPSTINHLISNATNRPVLLRIEGISGLNSKDIYYSFFDSNVRKVIEWGPDFCFVSAGINDTDRKVGSDCYKENMRLIISLLLKNNITPILLEIPYYDICKSFNQSSFIVKLRALRSMLWTWSAMDCIDDYSNSYNDLIGEQHWEDDAITIRRKQWNPDGYKDARGLYNEDGKHLNRKGYLVLDSCIATSICLFLRSK